MPRCKGGSRTTGRHGLHKRRHTHWQHHPRATEERPAQRGLAGARNSLHAQPPLQGVPPFFFRHGFAPAHFASHEFQFLPILCGRSEERGFRKNGRRLIIQPLPFHILQFLQVLHVEVVAVFGYLGRFGLLRLFGGLFHLVEIGHKIPYDGFARLVVFGTSRL